MELKFSYAPSKWTEATAVEFARAEPTAIPSGVAQAATDFLSRELAQLKLREPTVDGFSLFTRLAQVFPQSVLVVIGAHVEGTVPTLEGITVEEA
jgi:hypothetical protein